MTTPALSIPARPALPRLWALLTAALLALLFSLTGCERKVFSQDTPEETLASARAMIEKGQARRLHELIYAESPEMRQLLARTGRLFASLETLATQINTSYPEEIQKIKSDAQAGGVTQLLGRITQAQRRGRRGPPTAQEDLGEAVSGALKQVLADPYAFLRDNSGRLTTLPINDDTVALMWDSKPILPPLGMVMRREEDKWYIVLPTSSPFIARFMPKNPDEFKIFEKIIAVLDNAVRDLTKDIRTGKLVDLTEVSREAGKKVFVPIAIVAIAYGNMMEERGKAAPAPAAAPEAPATTPTTPAPR